MEFNYSQIEKNFTDYITSIIGPNLEQDLSREKKFQILKSIIQNALIFESNINVHIFSFGSFPLNTYLPDSDIDITLILEDKITRKIITNYSFEYLNK